MIAVSNIPVSRFGMGVCPECFMKGEVKQIIPMFYTPSRAIYTCEDRECIYHPLQKNGEMHVLDLTDTLYPTIELPQTINDQLIKVKVETKEDCISEICSNVSCNESVQLHKSDNKVNEHLPCNTEIYTNDISCNEPVQLHKTDDTVNEHLPCNTETYTNDISCNESTTANDNINLDMVLNREIDEQVMVDLNNILQNLF